MTREEQKAVRELKQAVEKMLRPCCKKFGYKTISGWVYKVVNDYIYILYVDVFPISLGKYITTKLSVKPTLIDHIFWDVYEMTDDVKGKPFSFHISAANAPSSSDMEKFDTYVGSLNEVESALEDIFKKSDERIAQYREHFSSLAVFKEEISNRNDPCSRLNIALCNMAEKNYQGALAIAQEELDKGGLGIFNRLDENGLVSIYSYIKKYCEERL